MGIQFLPGLGPQNSDIAAAVAAPSAATIAAAVAAPSAATIAAAVAAPSAATIATQVAASVPTLGQITSTVQANAGSPYGGTITNLGVASTSGQSAITWSSLGSYKYLRFFINVNSSSASNQMFYRYNGDASAIYSMSYYSWAGVGSGNYGYGDRGVNADRLWLEPSHPDFRSILIEIFNTNSGAEKYSRASGFAYVSNWGGGLNQSHGVYRSTSAISSVTIGITGGTLGTGNITAMGAA